MINFYAWQLALISIVPSSSSCCGEKITRRCIIHGSFSIKRIGVDDRNDFLNWRSHFKKSDAIAEFLKNGTKETKNFANINGLMSLSYTATVYDLLNRNLNTSVWHMTLKMYVIKNYGMRCSICLKEYDNLMPCENCALAMFCTESQDECMNSIYVINIIKTRNIDLHIVWQFSKLSNE